MELEPVETDVERLLQGVAELPQPSRLRGRDRDRLVDRAGRADPF